MNSIDGYFTDLSLLFLLRNARALAFARELESFSLIIETTTRISRPILGKFLFLYLVFYVYTQLGCWLFGGELTDETFIKDGAPAFWYSLNFNDFGAGLVVLFHQMIINNWFVTVAQFSALMGPKREWYVRLYFVSFWINVVLIELNIVIAIVLEIFGTVADQVAEQKNRE